MSMLKQIVDLNEDYYYGCIPIYKKNKINYMRKEKEDNFTIVPTTGFTNELVINETTIKILELCNGKHSAEDIEKKMKGFFPEVSSKTINSDVRSMLLKFSGIDLLIWKDGKNPFSISYEAILDEENTICLACENQIRDIVNTVKKSEVVNNTEFIYYVNPVQPVALYKNYLSMRYKLFSYNENFFLLKNRLNDYTGIISVINPLTNIQTVAHIGIIMLPVSKLESCFSFVKETYPKVSTSKATKIRVELMNNYKNYHVIIDSLKNIQFSNLTNLSKEYNEIDGTQIEYIF